MENIETNIRWYDFPDGQTVTVAGRSGEFFVIDLLTKGCRNVPQASSDSIAPAAKVRPVLGGPEEYVPISDCQESDILGG